MDQRFECRGVRRQSGGGLVGGMADSGDVSEYLYATAVGSLRRCGLDGPALRRGCTLAGALDACSPWERFGCALTMVNRFPHQAAYVALSLAVLDVINAAGLSQREGTHYRIASTIMLEVGSGHVWSDSQRRRELNMNSITLARFRAVYSSVRDALLSQKGEP